MFVEKSLFEQYGVTYRKSGDYLLPDIAAAPKNEKSVGIWAKRHHNYLRNTNETLFNGLIISGKMNDYLAEIDTHAEEMFSQLVKELAAKEGITEELKAADQLEWVRRMNAIRAQVTEIVNKELIFV